jgi:hypothetical protein
MAGTGGYETADQDQDQDRSTIRISGVLRNPTPAWGFGATSGASQSGATAEPAARRGRHGADEVHVVTGVPVRPATPATAPFDVFTPLRRSAPGSAPGADAPYAQSYPDFGGPAADDTSYVSPYSGPATTDYQDAQSGAGDGGSGFDDGWGNGPDGSGSSLAGEPAGSTEFKGLPRRVRQANLAPQLRASATPSAASAQDAGVPRATAASLADMRNTLSAMQRGWQQGRSQTQPNTEGGADGN